VHHDINTVEGAVTGSPSTTIRPMKYRIAIGTLRNLGRHSRARFQLIIGLMMSLERTI